MQRSRPRYSPEFREQMVALVRSGRTPESLSREFEPSAQSIRNWVEQSNRDTGLRADGLTSVRIASAEMLPWLGSLPHVKCSPGRSHGEHWNEESEHDGTGRVG